MSTHLALHPLEPLLGARPDPPQFLLQKPDFLRILSRYQRLRQRFVIAPRCHPVAAWLLQHRGRSRLPNPGQAPAARAPGGCVPRLRSGDKGAHTRRDVRVVNHFALRRVDDVNPHWACVCGTRRLRSRRSGRRWRRRRVEIQDGARVRRDSPRLPIVCFPESRRLRLVR